MFSSFSIGNIGENNQDVTIGAGLIKEKIKKIRSKKGCLCCRKRKKKCDEVYPICGSCKVRGQECLWDIKKYQPLSSNQISTDTLISSKVKPKDLENSFSRSVSGIDQNEISLDIEIPENEIEFAGGDFLTIPDTTIRSPSSFELSEFEFPDSPIYTLVPSSTFSLYLNKSGIRFLEFFENKVAKLLCISPESSNYFLKTFFTLSISEESISNALAAWGAVFSEGPGSQFVTYYLEKSSQLINSKYLNNNNQDKYGNYICLCYYMIAIGIYVCSGDTSKWYELFEQCGALFKKYGGINKFARDFNYSNDVKWLISNFQFHDVMSSVTLSKGTSFSMCCYNDLFKIGKVLDLGNYGVDPYQGCIQPIYLLLGEIMNSNVDLRKERQEINELLKDFTIDEISLNIRRLQYFKKIDEKFFEMITKLEFCKPNEIQMTSVSKEDYALHSNLFELYRMVCKMYLSLYIKQTQPKSSEVQNLLVSSLLLLDGLTKSKLVGSLNMALLICGICCCNEFDRFKMRNRFSIIYGIYKVGNLKKIWEVVEESWVRNYDGNMCIDWVDICDDFGWKLSIC